MKMMYLLFIFSLIIIRFFAGYDSRYQKGKYIVIRNHMLRIFLIDETSFFERAKRPVKDLNKISVFALIFYGFSLIVLALNIVLCCFIRRIAIEPWKIETSKFYVSVDTLNEKISAILIWLLFLAVIAWTAFCLIRCIKTVNQKWISLLIHIVSFVMLSAVTIIAFDMIKELLLCFI